MAKLGGGTGQARWQAKTSIDPPIYLFASSERAERREAAAAQRTKRVAIFLCDHPA
jgi:hypothetical protein